MSPRTAREPRTLRTPRTPREPKESRSPRTAREPREHKAQSDNDSMLYWGYTLLLLSSLAAILGVWSMLFLDALAEEKHYKYLVVFIVPVTLYCVIINWWGLKIFRHS